MKTMKTKRFTALLLAAMLCLQLGAVPAFAADGESAADTTPATETAAGSAGGTTAGTTEGTTAGTTEGATAGKTEGTTAGKTEGTTAGTTEGATAGKTEGATEGTTAGKTEGTTTGKTEGTTEGTTAGKTEGTTAGTTEGTAAGTTEGTTAVTTGVVPAAAQTPAEEKTTEPAAPEKAAETVETLVPPLTSTPEPAQETVSTDKTDILTDKTFTLTQDGKELKQDSGSVDTSKDFGVAISFGIPTAGDYYEAHNQSTDGLSDATVIRDGDIVTFTLPETVQIESVTADLLSAYEDPATGAATNYQIGSVSFSGNTITVRFESKDGIFQNPAAGANPFYGITARLSASLHFNGTKLDESQKETTIKLFDKTYTLKLDRAVNYTLTKNVRQDEKDPSLMHWSVNVSAAFADGGSHSLAGAVFTDDLRDAGDYQDDFKVDGNVPADSDGKPLAVCSDKTLTYAFPDDASASSAAITYTTKASTLADDFAGGATTKIFKNSAALSVDGKSTASDSRSVEYKMTAPVKTGFVSDDKGLQKSYKAVTDIDYSNFYITWKIAVNKDGYTLTNARVEDALPAALEVYETSAVDGAGNAVAVTPGAGKDAGVYFLGDADKNYTITGPVTLTIITRLNPSKDSNLYINDGKYYSRTRLSFTNTARFLWGEKGSLTSNSACVDCSAEGGTKIGYCPIDKTVNRSAFRYNANDHQIEWTISVDTKGQTYGDTLQVLDLLAHESDFDITSATGDLPNGLVVSALAQLPVSKNQSYVKDSFKAAAGSGLSCTATTLTDNAGRTADLVIVSGLNTDAVSFTLRSQITDPEIYAANGSNALRTLRNTAALYNGSQYVANDWEDYTVDSSMLKKDALSRNTTDDTVAENLKTAAADQAFNYLDKTAYFKLAVNKNSIDLGSDTNFAGASFTVTDTLADGWSFEKIGEANFLLFDKDGKAVDAADLVSMKPDGQTATFTFVNLPKQAYTIVVKAALSDAGMNAIVGNKSSETFNDTVNTAVVTVKNGDKDVIKPVTDTAKLKIPFTVLRKTNKCTDPGVVLWTVDFQTYGLTAGSTAGTGTVTLTDVLGEGAELRTDKNGQLLLTDSKGGANLTLTALTLGAGGYSAGSSCELKTAGKVGTDCIVSYDRATRTLTLELPDNGSSYRLCYFTDITAEGGSVSNTVTLASSQWGSKAVKSQYKVQAADASATMKRGNCMKLVKRGENNAALRGAAFTLTADGADTPFRTGTTNASGTLSLLALPTGSYTLRETQAPDGYATAAETWKVEVTADGTYVNGSMLEKSNPVFTVTDQSTALSTLHIEKQVAGTAADSSEKFSFTLTLPRSSTGYTGYGSDGAALTLQGGKNTFTLSAGQSITVINLPAGTAYSVAEADYTKTESYVTTVAVDGAAAETKNSVSGKTEKNRNVSVVFVNTKNKPETPVTPVEPVNPGTPDTPDTPVTPEKPTPTPSTPASPAPSVTPSAPTTSVPEEPVPQGNKPVPSPEAPVTVPDENVPTGDAPVSIPEGDVPTGSTPVTIPDGETPTAAAPKTGDHSALGLFGSLAAFSAAAIGCLLFGKRKRPDEDKREH